MLQRGLVAGAVLLVSIVSTIMFAYTEAEDYVDAEGGTGTESVLAPLLMVALFMVLAFGVERISKSRARIRLMRFAEANKMDMYTGELLESRDGVVFNFGTARTFDPRLTAKDGSYEWGNYSFKLEAIVARSHSSYGYIAIKLPRNFPDIVFDSKDNNAALVSNLPVYFKNKTKASLNNDFDRHFNVYMNRGDEPNTGLFMTENLLRLIANHASQYDIEIVNNTLYLYTMKFSLENHKVVDDAWSIARAIERELLYGDGHQQVAHLNVDSKNSVDYTKRHSPELRWSISLFRTLAIVFTVAIVATGIVVFSSGMLYR